MSEKEEIINEISKKPPELQVTKLSPLGYYHFIGDVLIFGEKEAWELSKKEVIETKSKSWGKHSDAADGNKTFSHKLICIWA